MIGRPMYYTLRHRVAIPTDDLMEWAAMLDNHDARRVAYDLLDGDIAVEVSTVFFGLDNNLHDGPPLIFETMVFGSELDQHQRRYSTWEEAEAGHRVIVEQLRPIVASSPSRLLLRRLIRENMIPDDARDHVAEHAAELAQRQKKP